MESESECLRSFDQAPSIIIITVYIHTLEPVRHFDSPKLLNAVRLSQIRCLDALAVADTAEMEASMDVPLLPRSCCLAQDAGHDH